MKNCIRYSPRASLAMVGMQHATNGHLGNDRATSHHSTKNSCPYTTGEIAGRLHQYHGWRPRNRGSQPTGQSRMPHCRQPLGASAVPTNR